MSRDDGQGQQPHSVMNWLLLALVTIMALAFLALGVWVRQETKRSQLLQAELILLRQQSQTTAAQLLELRNGAVALEDRLATLEANDVGPEIAALQTALRASSEPQNDRVDIEASLVAIQEDVQGLQDSLDNFADRVAALEAMDRVPAEAQLTVSPQKQSHNLSCESSAASMVAQFHDVNLSEADVLAALPLNPNPHLGFRGNVDGPTGGIEDYGVYAGPVLKVLNAQGLRARLVEGGLDGIKAAIARGNPVIAWVTYNCQPSTPTTTAIGDQEVVLVPWQHVVVVTGYNQEGVWANDPWDGKSDFYGTADFQRALSYFGDMALEVAAP